MLRIRRADFLSAWSMKCSVGVDAVFLLVMEAVEGGEVEFGVGVDVGGETVIGG